MAETQMSGRREDELITFMKGKENTLIEKSLDEFVLRLNGDVSVNYLFGHF
jgi:hypothetical protein